MPRFSFEAMPEQPLVSVLLSSYNYADYLPEAIASVFSQSYRPLELVIVDDGSTDESPALIRRLTQDAPIPVKLLLKENGGQASAWNAGFPKCRGELICLLDSDDCWRPEKVANMVAFAKEHPAAGLYQHQLDNGSEAILKEKLLNRDILRDWVALETVDVLKRHDLVAIFLPSSGLMARREVLAKVFPIPEQLVTCPDAYLTRMCCVYGPLCSNPEVLGSWREHPENAGKSERYGFEQYWLPVVMPAINTGFALHKAPVRFARERSKTPPIWLRVLRRLVRATRDGGRPRA